MKKVNSIKELIKETFTDTTNSKFRLPDIAGKSIDTQASVNQKIKLPLRIFSN